jgi:hypothetical protein
MYNYYDSLAQGEIFGESDLIATGQPVTVARTSGALEHQWLFMGLDPERSYLGVVKRHTGWTSNGSRKVAILTKRIPMWEIFALNPDPEEPPGR